MRIGRLARNPARTDSASSPSHAELGLADRADFVLLDAGHAQRFDRAPWDGGTLVANAARVPWTDADLACPVTPSKILCIGRNYAAHAKELGNAVPTEPLLFLKPPSALLGPGGTIRGPRESARVEHEAELGVVIGKRCRNATPSL